MKILNPINSVILSISLLTIAGNPLFAADAVNTGTPKISDVAEKAIEKVADVSKAITESNAWNKVITPTRKLISNHPYIVCGTITTGVVAGIIWLAYKKYKKAQESFNREVLRMWQHLDLMEETAQEEELFSTNKL